LEWKSINGYEDLYLINPKGTVISLSRDISTKNKYGEMIVHKKSKILKPHLRGRKNLKYLAMTLTKDGKSKTYSLHRLVAMAFLPNPMNVPEVNHKDKNTLNCNVENLEWCDHQYNIEYSKNKAIEQYYEGEKIAEYKSIAYASKTTGISRTSINNALKGWSMSAGGYVWKYKTNERSDDLSV
jgi:hypothetical protein